MLRRCRFSSRIGNRKALRKAHSPRPDAPCASCLAGTARRFGRVRIRRSCPETAPADDLPAWLPPVPSERSVRLRSATVPRSTRLDRRTFGLADPANRPAPRRSGPPPPGHATPLIPVAPGWLRYSLRPGIPIPAARCIRSSVRIRSAPPSGWRWCDSPSDDPRTRGLKWLVFVHRSLLTLDSFVSEYQLRVADVYLARAVDTRARACLATNGR